MRNVLWGQKNIVRHTIGIIGTHRGAGVTHTAIMMANYINEKKGRKTTVIEFQDHNDLKYIQMASNNVNEEPIERKFSIYGVDYLKNVLQSEIAEIFNQKYEEFILDFGEDFGRNRDEFLRCDTKIIITNLIEWKRKYLLKFIENVQEIQDFTEWNYLTVSCKNYDISQIKKENAIKIISVPYEADPFSLSKETVKTLEKIIK